MRLMLGDAVADWVCGQIADVTRLPPGQAIGVLDAADRLLAGFVFTNWQPAAASIEVSMAAACPRWCRPAVLRAVFAYPFHQLGCRRLSATTRADNARANRLLVGLGFTREGTLRAAAPDGSDLAVWGLLRAECRFLTGDQDDVVQPA